MTNISNLHDDDKGDHHLCLQYKTQSTLQKPPQIDLINFPNDYLDAVLQRWFSDEVRSDSQNLTFYEKKCNHADYRQHRWTTNCPRLSAIITYKLRCVLDHHLIDKTCFVVLLYHGKQIEQTKVAMIRIFVYNVITIFAVKGKPLRRLLSAEPSELYRCGTSEPRISPRDSYLSVILEIC